MVRTQILLDERHHRTLKRLSRERGISLSAVVREILDGAVIGGRARIGELAGIFSDDPAVAREHDRHIYEKTRPSRRKKTATR